MRRVDIGILLSEEIVYSLNGTFSGGGSENVTGEGRVSVSGDCVEWQGRKFDRLLFTPNADDCTFTVYNVVIGIDFHWERCENQLFAGELLFFVEDGKVRLVNRIGVEDYLQSVISSEMSSTSSLQLLKAHAVISRSWLYAQLARAEKSASKVHCARNATKARLYAGTLAKTTNFSTFAPTTTVSAIRE